jgi:hypothetical protein
MQVKRNLLLAILVLLTASGLAADRATHISVQGRDVAIWKPAGRSLFPDIPSLFSRTASAGAIRNLPP